MSQIKKRTMGWIPDYPDFRDYTEEVEPVRPVLEKTGLLKSSNKALPGSVDLRKWCSTIEDQGSIGSCTAHAGIGLVEYFEKKAFGKYIDASRLFLYKVTRNLLHWTGDTGAALRTTMAAMILFGVPPQEYWPYVEKDFDKEPTSFCYAFAQNYQAIKYLRLDPPDLTGTELLNKIKKYLSAGMPAMFGFSVYNSIDQAQDSGKIPFPHIKEKNIGGHAVMAVGYDDNKKIKNNINDKETKGAFLIRNSWGPAWGDNGYGWLPYEYVLNGLAVDWWTLLKNEWIDTGEFKL